MTEHIIQFGVGIDDDAIIKSVTEHAEHKIVKDIEFEVLKKIFESRYYSSGSFVTMDSRTDLPKVSNEAQFSQFAELIVRETIGQYKDDIIKAAAELLAASFMRTKAWKEATGKVINEVNT